MILKSSVPDPEIKNGNDAQSGNGTVELTTERSTTAGETKTTTRATYDLKSL